MILRWAFIGFLCCWLPISETSAQTYEARLLRTIHTERNSNLDGGFKVITHSIYPASILGPAIITTYGVLTRDTSHRNKGLFMIESLGVNAFATLALKYSIDRERPFNTYAFINPLDNVTSPSLPSGHTSNAFALATSLSMAYPRWYVIAPAFAYAATVSYSRMHLGVHYPSDILLGAVIGSGSAFLSAVINKKLFGTKKSPSRY